MIKYYLLFISLFISAIVMVGCSDGETKNEYIPSNRPNFTEPISNFHIKVTPHGDDCTFWQIIFTRDNFKTKENIMDAFDLSEVARKENIIYQKDLLISEQAAVAFAQSFKSYKDCYDYNYWKSRVFDSLSAYRKSHPIKDHHYRTWGSAPECDPNTEILIR